MEPLLEASDFVFFCRLVVDELFFILYFWKEENTAERKFPKYITIPCLRKCIYSGILHY